MLRSFSAVRHVASLGEGLSAVIVVCDRGCVTTATQALGDQPPSAKSDSGEKHKERWTRSFSSSTSPSSVEYGSGFVRDGADACDARHEGWSLSLPGNALAEAEDELRVVRPAVGWEAES